MKYVFDSINVYGSKENFYGNTKNHRIVFDEEEASYIYCNIELTNLLYKESDWNLSLLVVCINTETNEQICEITEDVAVDKEVNTISVKKGWGTPNVGWWKKGKYTWQVFYGGKEKIGEASFYITKVGKVHETVNPFFDIDGIKLFESDVNGESMGNRRYIKTFDHRFTRYVNFEFNLSPKTDFLPLELWINVFNSKHLHKARIHYFKEFNDSKKISVDTGYGASKAGYWVEGDYIMHINFMDVTIASIPFKVRDAYEYMDKNESHAKIVENTPKEVLLDTLSEEEKKYYIKEMITNEDKRNYLKSVITEQEKREYLDEFFNDYDKEKIKLNQKVIELIKNGKLETSLDLIWEYTNTTNSNVIKNEIIIIQSRLKNLNSMHLKGVIELDKYMLIQSQMTDATLKLINTL